jgi:hypothetical protein
MTRAASKGLGHRDGTAHLVTLVALAMGSGPWLGAVMFLSCPGLEAGIDVADVV